MKKLKKSIHACLLLGFILICLQTDAQAGKVPPFKMVQANGKIFSAQELPIGKPIIIIYFDPDCSHCETLVKELVSRKKEFRNASIAMITFTTVDAVSNFVKQYQLAGYNNMYVGTEGASFFVRDYYKIATMPYLALYTKSGDLVKHYNSEAGLKDLSLRLQSL